METFIWVMVSIMIVEAIAKIACLATGVLPKRTPGSLAFNLVISLVFIIWAVALLMNGS